MNPERKLVLNEWIPGRDSRYSYELFWPYDGEPNPETAEINIYVRLAESGKTYVGTFKTLGWIKEMFERCKSNGHCALGAYVPGGLDIILERLSCESIERSIEDILKESEVDFKDYFTPKTE